MRPRDRPIVFIPPKLAVAGIRYGQAKVRAYAQGKTPRSRARSGPWGAEKDIKRQAQGVLGEVALALYLGLDPATAINWTPDAYEQKGYDVLAQNGWRLDVKTTPAHYHLIWSSAVNDLYSAKHFDALVAVSIEPDNWSQAWIEGYVSKHRFLLEKHVADGSGRALKPGTWFMKKEHLNPIQTLLEQPDLYHCHCGQYACFGYGVAQQKHQRGTWFCGKHRPR